MGAVGAAVSVVGGVVGLSQQSRAANAQRQALASQQEQVALQSQLQYLALKQQTYADGLNDFITDKTRELQFAQAQTSLQAQQIQNDLAVSNAVFDANIQRTSADIQNTLANTQADRQQSQANLQAGQQTTEAMGQSFSQEQQLINSFLKQLGEGGQQQNAIANIIDQMASGGGVNEALQLLLDTNGEADVASANLQRQNQATEQDLTTASQLETTSVNLNRADRNTQVALNQVNREQQVYQADRTTNDALGSQAIANQGFIANRAANEANFRVGVLSDQVNRSSRDYLRQNNEQAILRGAQLQSDVLKAQASSIQSPGFMDYLNVGLQGYNTYRRLS